MEFENSQLENCVEILQRGGGKIKVSFLSSTVKNGLTLYSYLRRHFFFKWKINGFTFLAR